MDTSLKGKRALVTGAGGGIGREIACAMALEGARVAVNGRSLDRLSSTLQSIKNNGGEAFAALANLENRVEIENMCNYVVESLGGLDILVHNAGISQLSKIEDMAPSTWDSILSINLTAPFIITRHVHSELVRSGSGSSVIFISSIAADAHTAGWGAYAASKNGLNAFMHCLADELGMYGIRVNSIAPGWVDTKMAQNLHQGMAESSGESYEKLYNESMQGNMLGRMLTPDTIADMAVYLASERGRFITAQTLKVCGGDVPGSRAG